MTVGLHTRSIKVQDYSDLRDKIAESGVFEMTDCAVEIWCPEYSDADEIQRMTHLIESMVHVTDIKVGSTHEDLKNNYYTVRMTETPNNPRSRFSRGKG